MEGGNLEARPSANRLVQASETQGLRRPEGMGPDPQEFAECGQSAGKEDARHAMHFNTQILPL